MALPTSDNAVRISNKLSVNCVSSVCVDRLIQLMEMHPAVFCLRVEDYNAGSVICMKPALAQLTTIMDYYDALSYTVKRPRDSY